LLVHDADDISIIATLQQQSCKLRTISIAANVAAMEGLESDTEMVKALVKFTGMAPSRIAKEVGAAATTLLRPFNGTAETRLSQPTLDKLRKRWPDFPGWRNEYPDQLGMLGPQADPNERPDELVYVREVDISLAMGEGAVVEDYPAAQLVPFNLNFIRSVTKAKTEDLIIITGHGESMEPTLLRSDFLMIDTASRSVSLSDQIWAFHYAGGGMIKRLRRVRDDGRDRFLIISDNPAVPPQTADIEDVHLIGKLVWVGRRM
jgi:phage repressor protein C with HTH and peptisase S24 domain